MLTLYITPVIFVYMDQFTTWLRRRRRAASPVRGELAPAK
jgi:hypothetical protein